MIKLRVVGFSDDLKNLILSSRPQGRRGSHVTPIDDRLFDVLEDVWRRRRQDEKDRRKAARASEVPTESKLPPREVQRLLRAGHSPHDVAERAGVEVGWVERFYGPILEEKFGVVASVQSVWLEKPKAGPSGAPLGEAVAQNLRSRHVRMNDDQLAEAWDATRQDGQPWVVSLEFSFRGRKQRAVWRYEPHARKLSPANRLAADIGWVKNGKKAAARQAENTARPAARPRSSRTPARSRPRAGSRTRAPAKKRTATRRPPAKKRTTARRPPAKKRTTARRPPAKKRTTARRPAAVKRRTVTRRPAVRTRSTARAKKRTPARATTKRRTPARATTRRRTPARTTARRRTPARRSARRR